MSGVLQCPCQLPRWWHIFFTISVLITIPLLARLFCFFSCSLTFSFIRVFVILFLFWFFHHQKYLLHIRTTHHAEIGLRPQTQGCPTTVGCQTLRQTKGYGEREGGEDKVE